MNKLRPVALLSAGPVSRSPLARLPQLGRNLRWVKSTSFRVASRAVNALGAGLPVVEIAEMKSAAVWVISVPRQDLASSLSELREADVDWRGRVLLILDSEAESAVADGFRRAGAAIGSFAPIDAEGSRYVAEGDADAIRAVRWLIGDSQKKLLVEIKTGAKARYLAGAHAATKRILPLIAEAIDNFQSAGISNADSKTITESLLNGTMRLYFRAGRRSLK